MAKKAKIKIKQVKSGIDCPEKQIRTLRALGIRKLHQVVEKDATPEILGMVDKVKHLVEVVK
ncbi:50S ribosomal protein L30 [Saccharicrinis sp. FJH2]|uniref:50S ribosomal protein L30 n=1 Tax=unclassified Saccharicrinis TaxID=2646859 RepID=UPI0035D3E481